jgi:hypothetical protein
MARVPRQKEEEELQLHRGPGNQPSVPRGTAEDGELVIKQAAV